MTCDEGGECPKKAAGKEGDHIRRAGDLFVSVEETENEDPVDEAENSVVKGKKTGERGSGEECFCCPPHLASGRVKSQDRESTDDEIFRPVESYELQNVPPPEDGSEQGNEIRGNEEDSRGDFRGSGFWLGCSVHGAKIRNLPENTSIIRKMATDSWMS